MTFAKKIMALAALPALAAAMPAQAAVYSFALGDLSWSIDTDDAPFAADPDAITYAGVATGTAGGSTVADIDFFSATIGGGVRVTDFDSGDILGWYTGPTLYSSAGGTIAFTPGTFALTPVDPSTGGSITISAVPETASWALMIAGFGMTGAALRGYRRRRTVAAIAG